MSFAGLASSAASSSLAAPWPSLTPCFSSDSTCCSSSADGGGSTARKPDAPKAEPCGAPAVAAAFAGLPTGSLEAEFEVLPQAASCIGKDAIMELSSPTRAARMPEVGSFEEDYDLLPQVLGRGLTGTVHTGICRRTGRLVAVKRFEKARLSSQSTRNMRAEINVLAGLSHPGIVSLHDVYETETKVIMVMECLEGGELFDRVMHEGPMSEDEARGVAVQVLDIVAHLHAQNVCHRDVKLENLVYERSGGDHLKLIDFGFATRFTHGSKLTMRAGTMGYAAPEVLAGRTYGPKCDIYSVGSTLYSVLTSRALFKGGQEEAYRKNRAGLIDWSIAFGRLSEEAQDFLLALLSPNPAGRPTAEEALRHPWLTGSSLSPTASALGTMSPSGGGEASSPSAAMGFRRRPLAITPRHPSSAVGCSCGIAQVFQRMKGAVVNMIFRLELAADREAWSSFASGSFQINQL